VKDHPTGYWLIVGGGVVTLLGLGLTFLTVYSLRRAIKANSKLIFVNGSARSLGGGPRPPIEDLSELPLAGRMSYLESVVSQLRWEWREDIRREVNDALDEADKVADRKLRQVTGAMRDLMAPFTKDWRMAAASGLLLAVGVVMQTTGSLLVL
jgi:hypothetical protein